LHTVSNWERFRPPTSAAFRRRLVEFISISNFGTNTFVFNPVENITQDQYIFRIDHTFNQNNVLWGSAAIEHFPDTFTLPFLGANLPGFGETDNSHTKQITVAFNHSFSPNTLNEARVGYSRLNFASVFPTDPAQPSSFGFTGITPQSSSGASAPLIGVTGFFTLGFSGNGPQPRIVQNYQFTDNFSKIIGKHSLKAGFEMRRYHVFNPFSANNNGDFTFGATGPFSTGNAGADFLLGFPDSYTQGSGDTIDATTQEYYSYVQDQWKVRDNFTLNIGLGWQIDTPARAKLATGCPSILTAGRSPRSSHSACGTGVPRRSGTHFDRRGADQLQAPRSSSWICLQSGLGPLVRWPGQAFDSGRLRNLLQQGRGGVGAAECRLASIFNLDQYGEPFVCESIRAHQRWRGDAQSFSGNATAGGQQRRLHPVRG
jgi:hypothetical protein